MNKVALLAFNDELQKLALWEKLVPIAKKVLEYLPKLKSVKKLQAATADVEKAIEVAGPKGGLEAVKKFATPKILKTPNGGYELAKPIDHAVEANSGMFQRAGGDMVTKIDDLSEGITSANTLSQNASQFGKNFINSSKQELRNAAIKHQTVESLGNDLISENGKYFVKGKWGLPKRKVLNSVKFDANGNPIGDILIKKRLLPRLGAQAMTPTGMGITATGLGLATGSSPQESIKDGIKDYVSWSTPLGPALMLKDFGEMGYNAVKNVFNKNNNTEE